MAGEIASGGCKQNLEGTEATVLHFHVGSRLPHWQANALLLAMQRIFRMFNDDMRLVDKVQRTSVNWAARCRCVSRQNLACAQRLTMVPTLALCHFCHKKEKSQHLSVSC
jgi:hypothetical protein